MLFGFGRFGALPSYQDKTSYTTPLAYDAPAFEPLTTSLPAYQDKSTVSLPSYQDTTTLPAVDAVVKPTTIMPGFDTATFDAAKTAIDVQVVDSSFLAPAVPREPLRPREAAAREVLSSEVLASEASREREAQMQEEVQKQVSAAREAAANEARARDLEDEARRQVDFENAQRLLREAEEARRKAAGAKVAVEEAKQKRVEVAQKPPEVLLADASTRKTKKWVWIAGGALLVKFLLF